MSHKSETQLLTSNAVVFVIDEDERLRKSLETLIRRAGWCPKTFTSAEEFLHYPRRLVPSCLVSDISLPDLDGLQLQGLLADRSELPVIFMTSRVNMSVTVQAMKGGAVEFLVKPIIEEVLLNAMRQALERSGDALHREREMRVIRQGYASLSTRERQVLGLLIQGMMNKQIGGELGISVITVKAHRSKLMRKMGARSVAELVTMAVSLELLPVRNKSRPYFATVRPANRPTSGEDRHPPTDLVMDVSYPPVAGIGAFASG